jgi:hypothetical protein
VDPWHQRLQSCQPMHRTCSSRRPTATYPRQSAHTSRSSRTRWSCRSCRPRWTSDEVACRCSCTGANPCHAQSNKETTRRSQRRIDEYRHNCTVAKHTESCCIVVERCIAPEEIVLTVDTENRCQSSRVHTGGEIGILDANIGPELR